MYWFWIIILLITFALSSNSSEAKKHHKKSSAVVIGTVNCDMCFQQDIPKASSHFIAGASVAVECKDTTRSNPTFRQEVKTDSHGQFKVHLPFPVSKHIVKKIKGCSVKLITSNKPYCSIAATATSSNLHLISRKQGIHIFSAGFFTFKPLKKPTVCDQKPSTNNNLKKLNTEKPSPISNPDDPTFLPPVQDLPPSSEPPNLLPPLPQLPDLPRLPPLPGIPFFPQKPKKETGLSDNNNNNNAVNQPDLFPFPPNPFNPPSIFPPNPFQPPHSLIPPVFPSPPSSIFPPIFPAPSPPPFFQLPPIPGLTPSLSPPPPPVFLIPLPPFPFQPSPGFPGVPPAEVSSPSKTSSP